MMDKNYLTAKQVRQYLRQNTGHCVVYIRVYWKMNDYTFLPDSKEYYLVEFPKKYVLDMLKGVKSDEVVNAVIVGNCLEFNGFSQF